MGHAELGVGELTLPGPALRFSLLALAAGVGTWLVLATVLSIAWFIADPSLLEASSATEIDPSDPRVSGLPGVAWEPGAVLHDVDEFGRPEQRPAQPEVGPAALLDAGDDDEAEERKDEVKRRVSPRKA